MSTLLALFHQMETVYLTAGRDVARGKRSRRQESILAWRKVGRQAYGVGPGCDFYALEFDHVAGGSAGSVDHAPGHRPEFPVFGLGVETQQLVLGERISIPHNNQELERSGNGCGA